MFVWATFRQWTNHGTAAHGPGTFVQPALGTRRRLLRRLSNTAIGRERAEKGRMSSRWNQPGDIQGGSPYWCFAESGRGCSREVPNSGCTQALAARFQIERWRPFADELSANTPW